MLILPVEEEEEEEGEVEADNAESNGRLASGSLGLQSRLVRTQGIVLWADAPD